MKAGAEECRGGKEVFASPPYRAFVYDSLDQLPVERWDELVGAQGCPFLSTPFLLGLERCGCVGEETGWIPRYLCLWDGEELVAATALYRKHHSQGEFVFDQSWAEAAHRGGFPYYPKLVAAAPFSPRKALEKKEETIAAMHNEFAVMK